MRGDAFAAPAPAEMVLSEAALRSRRSEKWQRLEPHILPADVGEMDFSVAEAVHASIMKRCGEGDFNYFPQGNEALACAFATRMRAHFDWTVDPRRVRAFGDVVQGLYASVMAFSERSDGVVVMTPTYTGLRDAVIHTGRQLLTLPLSDDGAQYTFDVEELDALMNRGARLLLLCHPHNPTGRVFTRAELMSIGERAVAHDMVVVSDEIHAELAFAGRAHLPFASLEPEIAARTVTLTSASKSFNLPGLRCALAYFGSSALQRQFERRLPPALLGDPAPLGVDATIAAWSEGQAWLDMVKRHLAGCRDYLASALRTRLPEIRWHPPDATYFAWLDCEALKLDVPAARFFHDAAHIALSPGEAFDPQAPQFVRMNFATSHALLEQILERMVRALERRR